MLLVNEKLFILIKFICDLKYTNFIEASGKSMCIIKRCIYIAPNN